MKLEDFQKYFNKVQICYFRQSSKFSSIQVNQSNKLEKWKWSVVEMNVNSSGHQTVSIS